jgi:hypothetical protein
MPRGNRLLSNSVSGGIGKALAPATDRRLARAINSPVQAEGLDRWHPGDPAPRPAASARRASSASSGLLVAGKERMSI